MINEDFRILTANDGVNEYPLTPIEDIQLTGSVETYLSFDGQSGTVGLPLTDESVSDLTDDPERIEVGAGTATPVQKAWANGYMVDDFADTNPIDGNRPNYATIYPEEDARSVAEGDFVLTEANESTPTRPTWGSSVGTVTTNNSDGTVTVEQATLNTLYDPAGQAIRLRFAHTSVPTEGWWEFEMSNQQGDAIRFVNDFQNNQYELYNPFDNSVSTTSGTIDNTSFKTFSLVDDRSNESVYLYDGGSILDSNADTGSTYGQFSSEAPIEYLIEVSGGLDANLIIDYALSTDFG